MIQWRTPVSGEFGQAMVCIQYNHGQRDQYPIHTNLLNMFKSGLTKQGCNVVAHTVAHTFKGFVEYN